jgi:hypothetical protein
LPHTWPAAWRSLKTEQLSSSGCHASARSRTAEAVALPRAASYAGGRPCRGGDGSVAKKFQSGSLSDFLLWFRNPKILTIIKLTYPPTERYSPRHALELTALALGGRSSWPSLPL